MSSEILVKDIYKSLNFTNPIILHSKFLHKIFMLLYFVNYEKDTYSDK